MLLIQFLIPLAFLLGIDAYFFQLLKTLLKEYPGSTKALIASVYWVANALVLLTVIFTSVRNDLPNYLRYYTFSLLLVIFIPKLIGVLFLLGEDLYRVVTGLFHLVEPNEQPFLSERRTFVSKAALITASIPFATMLYGMARTAFNLKVRKVNVEFSDLPDPFDGLRIVQISDLHAGSFSSPDFFRAAFDAMMDLKPDLIFFTGDLVNNASAEAEPFIDEFKKLRAKFGVYSILGNHDYGDYGPWPSTQAKAANLERLKAIHQEAGWKLLLNDHQLIDINGEKLAIVGVENWGASRHFPKYGNLDKAVEGANQIPFKILLSHDPSHWEAQVVDHPQKFQLTFSGHTHGFQFGIEIPGFKWSPVQYVYKQWAGLYERNDQKLYVNRGLGFIGYMGRIGIPPEITLMELRSVKIT
ncbi:MAG: hypothetical protein RL266_546 [Bacteroidota bacterium]|jgi:predicted MPP superfamily phosphohydrolase